MSANRALPAAGRRLARGVHRIAGTLRRARPATLLAAVAVAALAATLAVRVGSPPSSGSDGFRGGSPARVGVSDGDSVPGYVAASRDELSRLAEESSGPVYALVSLDEYAVPDRIVGVLEAVAAPGDGRLATVVVLARVPLPRRQTEIVRLPAQRLPADVVAAMGVVAARKERAAAAYAQRAERESDAARRALYRSGAEVSAAEAAAYRDGCACIFALVVRATPAQLLLLAAATPVRAVDAAPEVDDITEAVFVAPLPEQVDVVRPLPDDLTSSDGVTPAVRSS